MMVDVERLDKPAPRATGVRRALRRMSSRRRREERELDAAKREVMRRSRGWCEIRFGPRCTLRATEFHHRLPRSAGGPHEPWNLLHGCHTCHDDVELHREVARARGLLLSRYPGRRP